MPEDNQARSNQSAPGPEGSEPQADAGTNQPAEGADAQREGQSGAQGEPETQPSEPGNQPETTDTTEQPPATDENQPQPQEEQPSEPEEPPTPEMTPSEKLQFLSEIVDETEQRERERMEQKYGKGIIGKCRTFLNETQKGRIIKIIGKIALGTSAALGAGIVAGPAALILAPALYTLGLKTAIDGGIEAVQQFSKEGRELRLKLEAARQDIAREDIEEKFNELLDKKARGEIDEAGLAAQIAELTEAIRSSENEVIIQEKAVATLEKGQAAFRAKVSMVAAIGISIMTGVPLGLQNFDADKAQHMVRFGFHGFQYIQQAGGHIFGQFGAQHVVMAGHAATIGAHGVAQAGTTAAGYIGSGLGIAALFAATRKELKMAKDKGWIESDNPADPEYLKKAKKYKRGMERRGATPAAGEGAGTGEPTSGPTTDTTEGAEIDVGFTHPTDENPPQSAEENNQTQDRTEETTEENTSQIDAEEEKRTAEQSLNHLKTLLINISRLTIEVVQAKQRQLTEEQIQELNEERRLMEKERDRIIEILGLTDNPVYRNWVNLWGRRFNSQAIIESYTGQEGAEETDEVKTNKAYIETHTQESETAENDFYGLIEQKKRAKEGEGEATAT